MTGTSGSEPSVSTRLLRIAELARKAPEMVLTTLAHHIDPPVVQRVRLCVCLSALLLLFWQRGVVLPGDDRQPPQWSLVNGDWYSVNPPPTQDRRHKFPNAYKDPNFDAPGRDHLYYDYSYSAQL